MALPWRWITALLSCAVVACALVVMTDGGPSQARLRCPLSRTLVPACGALWGITTRYSTLADVHDVERLVGRQFDVVYRFHDLFQPFPDAQERALAARGTILHVSIEPRDFTDPGRHVTWAQVAQGLYDDRLRRLARGVASLRTPVFVTFAHEPDQSAKRALGTPSDFVAAWRHVHDVFEETGAANAVWVWVVMGYPPSFPTDARMWPGDSYVDWISAEAYNGSGCAQGRIQPEQYRSFASAFLPFYRWLHTAGRTHGIDASKPLMISEAGSVTYPQAPGRTAHWFAQIPATLRKYPQVKAVQFWDSVAGACDFRFQDDAVALGGVRAAGHRGWVDVRQGETTN